MGMTIKEWAREKTRKNLEPFRRALKSLQKKDEAARVARNEEIAKLKCKLNVSGDKK